MYQNLVQLIPILQVTEHFYSEAIEPPGCSVVKTTNNGTIVCLNSLQWGLYKQVHNVQHNG